MVMTDGEIVTSYRQARNHRAQITVLADLNNCDRAAMEAKLVELGCIRATPAPSFDFLRAAELYAAGKSDLEIAEQLGCGKAAVARWRKSKDLAANYPKTRAARKETAKPNKRVQKRAGPAAAQAPAGAMTVQVLAGVVTRIAEVCPDAQVFLSGKRAANLSVAVTFSQDGSPLAAVHITDEEA